MFIELQHPEAGNLQDRAKEKKLSSARRLGLSKLILYVLAYSFIYLCLIISLKTLL